MLSILLVSKFSSAVMLCGLAAPGENPQPDSGYATVLAVNFDLDADGVISEREMGRAKHTLAVLDDDGDGQVTAAEITANLMNEDLRKAFQLAARTLNADRDDDGKLSKAETPDRMKPGFGRLDRDKDGFLTGTELKARFHDLIRSGVNVEVRGEKKTSE